MIRAICCIALLMLASCGSKYRVTDEYVYNSEGFCTGLSIAVLGNVNKLDENGIPFNSIDSIRIDLLRKGNIVKKKYIISKKMKAIIGKYFYPIKNQPYYP